MKARAIHCLQTMWVITVVFLSAAFVKCVVWSLWLSVPVAIVGFIALSWIGITVIAMFDYEFRMAGRYNIKIENVPRYKEIFQKLENKESMGINTFGIPDEITDVEEWLRYYRWMIDESLTKTQKKYGDET